jgi:hypothetical protein
MPEVINAEYHINRNLQLRGNVTLNEFYDFLGIDKIAEYEGVGWDLSDMMEDNIMWLDFDNRMTKMEDGMECCVISAMIEPRLCFE